MKNQGKQIFESLIVVLAIIFANAIDTIFK